MRRTLLDNPDLFIVTYFPDEIKKLEPFHRRLIRTATQEPRGLILYPAGHGKTTLVSICLPIWAICRNPDIRIGIIAKNEIDAKGIMRDIHSKLLGNRRLIEDFGPFYDADDPAKAWTIERIDVAKGKMRKEGSIQMYGSKGNVLGKRFDWVICDDVVTDKNSATELQRIQMREWFNLGVATMPEYPEAQEGHEQSRLTVIGTLFHPEDLYNDLRDLRDVYTEKPLYATQREDAIVDEDLKTPLWPAKWSWDALMQMKQLTGTLDFNKRYRNIAVDASRRVFREEYLRGGRVGREDYPGCLDESYRAGDWDESWRRVGGFDPALGYSKVAKYSAHIVLGLGTCQLHERCFWVVDLKREQFTQPQQVDLIIDQHEEFELHSTVIEVNGYQLGLEQVVKQRLTEMGKAFTIEPHHTSRNNKPDPEIGVSGMSAMFERGLIHIPWGDAHSRRVMMPLVDELIEWPGGRTSDTVMALWFAWKRMKETAPKFGSFNRLARQGSVYKKLGRSVQNPAYS